MNERNRGGPYQSRAWRVWLPRSPRILWTAFAVGIVFLVAVGRGYVDAGVTAVAILTLFAVIERPHRAHPVTTVVLTAVTAILLWANLRQGWEDLRGMGVPVELNSVRKALFWRGWPACPFMVCPYRHMDFLPAQRSSSRP